MSETNHTSSASETTFYSSDLTNWDIHTEGIRHRGNWQGGVDGQGNSINTWYAINDIVKYGNTQYRAAQGHTSTATFNTTYWNLYAEGLNFEDTWNSSTKYQTGDIVTYGGYSYIAEDDSQNIQPNTDAAKWKVISTGYLSQGTYDPAVTYKPGNVVRYGGNTYSCKVTTDNETFQIGSTTGTGTVATAIFANGQASAPFGIGDQVIISNSSIAGYNGTHRVLSVSTTQFTYSSATTGFYRWFSIIQSCSNKHKILGSCCTRF